MKKVKIFLASSKDLKAERERFEIEIYRKCKAWSTKGVFLHLEIWEDHTSRVHKKGTQNAYNKKVQSSTIFVLLAHHKIGTFTAEEFESAYGHFLVTKKPVIFTYFKELEGTTPEPSLLEFQQKLRKLHHFYSYYNEVNDLWCQFSKELDRLLFTDYKEHTSPKIGREANGTVSNIAGNQNFVFQNISESKTNVTIGSEPDADYKGRDKSV